MSGKAFITGGARNIGAESAVTFAEIGWDVAIGATRESKDLKVTLERLGGLGVEPLVAFGDITLPDSREKIVADVIEWADGRLNAVVLNAAGGLERDQPPEYGMVINRDAQVALAELFSRDMSPDGRIVFVTSHWGHWYNRGLKMPPIEVSGKTYDVVASSKHAGETALREMIPEMYERGVSFAVVSGGYVPDSLIGRLGKRGDPNFVQRQIDYGNAPSKEEMGRRITLVAADSALPNDHLEIVGADEETFLKHESLEA
jgi:3-oxoacyl-[acyl-carrier protein] reductase